jgi:pheromone shutdown-related protein TraB
MSDAGEAAEEYGDDVLRVWRDGREFILVGTAHISQRSTDLVRQVIEGEKPDTVCVELDAQRHKALAEKVRWENLDLKTVIRQKQLSTLMVNLILGSYQKKLGEQLGVSPGAELLEAMVAAADVGVPTRLCDRDIRVTLRRAWHSMSLWEKLKFAFSGLGGVFADEEVSEESLQELRSKDVLSELMGELGRAMPVLKTVLLDERDAYLAEKMRQAPGQRVVAVVGAGHVEGIARTLAAEGDVDLAPLEVIPPPSPWLKIIGWGVPALVVGSIAYIGWSKGLAAAGDNALFWILANGIPSAIGALLALGHPLTVVCAFIAAPFTSLTPVIGAGYVAAFVQVYFAPPLVREFHRLGDDAGQLPMWWKSRLLRTFLVFVLTSLGSMVGTYVGAYEIIRNLF